MSKIKTIVTLGPATNSEADLRKIKDKGVDFVRINMSHSSIDDLERFVAMAKKVNIPFIIDTEGSQVRSGDLEKDTISFDENDIVKIYVKPVVGNKEQINLKPESIVKQLEEGDLIHIDFDTLILRVSDTSTIAKGYIVAKAITSGFMGKNKAVVIDAGYPKKFVLPVLTEKDYGSIKLGLKQGVKHIAVSFVRKGSDIDEVRVATKGRMKIISKIECIEALENLDDIIVKSDTLLIDRGDLSKEIPIEKIPFTQKIIINKARKKNKDVFVATNLLETMIEKKKPTRAEVNDIVNTILDGASGLTLAAETAIGKYPMECINTLNRLIKCAKAGSDKILDEETFSSLIPPHGGRLVNRMGSAQFDKEYLNALPKVMIDKEKQMDVEQIAVGSFSPIEGFMGKADLESVLDNMRLKSGIVWTIPILLDVSEEVADKLEIGNPVGLIDETDEVMAVLHLEEKYSFDKKEMKEKLYGTDNGDHPGVRMIKNMHPVFLAGKIDLLKRMRSKTREYELTPKQVRRLFEERGWSKIVGFHTGNVINRSHEFMQLKAMEQEHCDGIFVHLAVGKKKTGDFNADHIIGSYALMSKQFYPKDKVIFSVFSTFSRYAGPREAIFAALCRKNYGCSHFIVGSDHAGVGDFYHPKMSHDIFDQFSDADLGIKPLKEMLRGCIKKH